MTTFSDLFGAQTDEERIELRMERIALSFQIAIQNEMDARGLSKADLAKLMGVSAARVSQILGGHANNLTLKSVARMAEALGCDFEAVEKSAYLDLIRSKKVARKDSSDYQPAKGRLIRSNAFWHDTTANKNKFPEALAA